MKLKQIGKLFPDLKKYNVHVIHNDKRYVVDDLRNNPKLLDRDIQKIYLHRGMLFRDSIGMEILI